VRQDQVDHRSYHVILPQELEIGFPAGPKSSRIRANGQSLLGHRSRTSAFSNGGQVTSLELSGFCPGEAECVSGMKRNRVLMCVVCGFGVVVDMLFRLAWIVEAWEQMEPCLRRGLIRRLHCDNLDIISVRIDPLQLAFATLVCWVY
jgi:hypothetical protein